VCVGATDAFPSQSVYLKGVPSRALRLLYVSKKQKTTPPIVTIAPGTY
jgi:hypothetical protein